MNAPLSVKRFHGPARKSLLKILAAACIGGALAGPAAAGVLVPWPNPYPVNGGNRESYSNWTSVTENGVANAYSWGGISIWNIAQLGGQVFTLCIEPTVGGWGAVYDVTPGLATPVRFSLSRQNAFDVLITNTMPTFLSLRSSYLSTMTSASLDALNDYALAMQLATWELSEETGTALSLSPGANQGSFFLTGPNPYGIPFDANADAIATGFIANIASSTWTATGLYQLNYGYSLLNQDMLMITPLGFTISAIPEPGSLPVALAGLGALAFALRRRGATLKVSKAA